MGIKQSDGSFHHASAICHFPFVCTLESGQPLWCLKCETSPCRACPYATKIISREPNTPLAFRRLDACHLKQQAGHGKITVLSGQNTKDSISRIADYDKLYFAYSSAEEQIWTLCCLRNKNASKIPHRYLSGKSSPKHTKLFGKTLYNSTP